MRIMLESRTLGGEKKGKDVEVQTIKSVDDNGTLRVLYGQGNTEREAMRALAEQMGVETGELKVVYRNGNYVGGMGKAIGIRAWNVECPCCGEHVENHNDGSTIWLAEELKQAVPEGETEALVLCQSCNHGFRFSLPSIRPPL